MKKDLDKLMKKMRVDAIFAQGSSNNDPTIYYLLNGINVSGIYIKKRGERAYFIHSPIEREEALKTGLRLISMNKYDIRKTYNKYKDRLKASALFAKMVLDDLKVKGNVAFYGNVALGSGYNYLRQVLKFDKKISVHYDCGKSLVTRVREAKDEDEVSQIKQARNGVSYAFNALLKQAQKMRVEHNTIMKGRGKKLLIGDLKDMIKMELFKKGLVSSCGLIVAQGRDAGVPHNSGEDREAVKLGKTIVFDIFPQKLGGGYFFDFTRTVCFGFASAKLKELYRLVSDAQDYIFNRLKVGKRTGDIETAVCKFFEKSGHPTFLSNSKTEVGYCHSLGHGLGLNIHESPSFGLAKNNPDRIEPGMVFTVEPGLYYPEKNFGIRLEDVIYVDKKGKMINLTNYPRKLVVEM